MTMSALGLLPDKTLHSPLSIRMARPTSTPSSAVWAASSKALNGNGVADFEIHVNLVTLLKTDFTL
jgi:hypothetical protein